MVLQLFTLITTMLQHVQYLWNWDIYNRYVYSQSCCNIKISVTLIQNFSYSFLSAWYAKNNNAHTQCFIILHSQIYLLDITCIFLHFWTLHPGARRMSCLDSLSSFQQLLPWFLPGWQDVNFTDILHSWTSRLKGLNIYIYYLNSSLHQHFQSRWMFLQTLETQSIYSSEVELWQ